MKIMTHVVSGSGRVGTEISDDIADGSRLIIKGELRHVENDPKELLICVPTRSEWLFYWIKGEKHCARRRAQKSIKYYVSRVNLKK
ncbi:hypothetical protein XX58_002326 [Salmonella enterica subsp. salamae]|uniref:Doubtful CDS found within S. typhi pathogenicity island n=14 Tax=Salmonella enterica TaxID=28901 RepID=A0A344QYG0_SALER|nr:hypothetical protein DOE60_15565 [Salmonella enterica subsp. salamae serovar 56:z10:e,n,x]AXC84796.1 hypothetical protein DOE57_05475 [Salmonella enterica subsp. salamae serovar 56:b:[1,5]]EAA4437142.1 hypothetical protein [Salmonella enterica subsp. salamae]EAA8844267.1 hypothetical protein [Salmonella enterica subsp. enterica]EAA9517079.1 hypothetical protein [Salmonella enterica]EBI0474631.1 hypothetical protein [Salmonella enterica subsp. enterica serovar Braenderup]EBW7588513.1 hypoth